MGKCLRLHECLKKYNYSKLLGRIKEYYGKQSAFADAMGLSARSVSLKLNNLRGWTQPEIDKACKVLKLSTLDIPDYFFIEETQY